MKKLLLLILAMVMLTIESILCLHPDRRDDLAKFREAMNFIKFRQYVDTTYRYSFPLPEFFQKEDCPESEKGYALFGYHAHNLNLVIECKVVPDNRHEGSKGDFIDTGNVSSIDDYKYYSHHVFKGDHYLILTFYYPRKAENAVGRIIYRVKKWKPFSEKKLTLGNQEP